MSGTAMGPEQIGTSGRKKKNKKPKGYNSDDYNDKKAKYEFSKEYNDTGEYVITVELGIKVHWRC